MVEVTRIFREDCPPRLAAIQAAIEGRDGEGIRQTAHALKGAAGNLSATRLFQAARTLELLGGESRFAAAEAAWRVLSVEASAVLDTLARVGAHEVAIPAGCRA
jgi:HPt (histidine-containing phosphotransfer) domain-containing protein